jgi:hypothetical protein
LRFSLCMEKLVLEWQGLVLEWLESQHTVFRQGANKQTKSYCVSRWNHGLCHAAFLQRLRWTKASGSHRPYLRSIIPDQKSLTTTGYKHSVYVSSLPLIEFCQDSVYSVKPATSTFLLSDTSQQYFFSKQTSHWYFFSQNKPKPATTQTNVRRVCNRGYCVIIGKKKSLAEKKQCRLMTRKLARS